MYIYIYIYIYICIMQSCKFNTFVACLLIHHLGNVFTFVYNMYRPHGAVIRYV
jgi:hypothetical protein